MTRYSLGPFWGAERLPAVKKRTMLNKISRSSEKWQVHKMRRKWCLVRKIRLVAWIVFLAPRSMIDAYIKYPHLRPTALIPSHSIKFWRSLLQMLQLSSLQIGSSSNGSFSKITVAFSSDYQRKKKFIFKRIFKVHTTSKSFQLFEDWTKFFFSFYDTVMEELFSQLAINSQRHRLFS